MFLGSMILVLFISLAFSAPIKDNELERAILLMEQHPLIDGHNDLPYQLYGKWNNQLARVNLNEYQPSLHTDIPRLREGRMGAQFWSVYVGCNSNVYAWTDSVRATIDQIDVTRRMIDAYPDTFELALTSQDIKDIFARGKIASLMGMEGGHSIDSSLGTLRMMYDLGSRYMTLTHNCHTPWADSTSLNPIHNGLTDFGVDIIREMNRLGMFIDLSHVSHDVMRQVLGITRAPVIFSHSSAYSLCNNTRNVPDDVLSMMKANGGVVMVNFYSNFVCCQASCQLSDVADHIEHLVNVGGVEIVGIGGDYDGVPSLPVGLEDVSTYPELFAELLRRGFSDQDIIQILGGNLLRAMEQMEIVAQAMQAEGPPGETFIKFSRTCPNDEKDQVPEL